MKKCFPILAVIVISLFFSCKKDVYTSTPRTVTFSEEVNQITFSEKPNFEIAYSKNTIIDGEIAIQLLDKNGTVITFLPNSNLIYENGVVSINNTPYLKNGKEYLFKISNYTYNNSYYQFNTDVDTSHRNELFIKFSPVIKGSVTDIFIETFDLSVQDNLGPQRAIKYGAKTSDEILLHELDLFIQVTASTPWHIFDKILLKDNSNLLIKEKMVGERNNWIIHNDSLYELKINNLDHPIPIGEFNHNVEMEIKNCIDTLGMEIQLKATYTKNRKKWSFETPKDSLKIRNI